MDPTSLEFWEWFYEPTNRGAEMSSEERQRAAEERWHADLVLIQSPEMPDTAGEFHGFAGLAAAMGELLESWEEMRWEPLEVHGLGNDQYLVLLDTSGRGRGSGIELGGREIAHIITLRDGKAERLETYLSWDAARQAAGLR